MAIAVTCANCGVRLRFKSEHTGKTAKCRACGESLTVQGDAIPDHDVFLSYSSKDKNIADAICAAMESKRVRCWIAPRDILAGKAWAGAILDAIDDVPVMVLVYSENSNHSPQVLREIDRAISRNVIVVPFRIDASAMTKEMEYYIAAAHWLDAMDGPMEQHITKLVDTVQRLRAPEAPAIKGAWKQPETSKRPASPRHNWLTLASIGLSIVAIAGMAYLSLRKDRSVPEHPASPQIAVTTAPATLAEVQHPSAEPTYVPPAQPTYVPPTQPAYVPPTPHPRAESKPPQVGRRLICLL